MSILVSLLLVSIFSFEYLAIKLGVISRFFALVPDVIGVVILLFVIGRVLVIKHWRQSPKYLVLLVVFTLSWLVSAVAESVSPGVLINGLRDYFKFFPLLFLPAVYEFRSRDLSIILGTYLFLAAIQVPIAFYQRFVQFAASMHTGDPVTGTVTTSSAMTIVLCIAIALVMTYYVNRKISFPLAAILFAYFAAPTAINETKATVILLPLATIGPFIIAKGIEDRWKRAMPVLVLCAVGIVAFVAVYNVLIQARWWGGGHEVGDFFAGGHVTEYIYRGASADDPPEFIGRLDSIVLPMAVFSDNWMNLLFGLGPGNVSPSFLPGMEGEYYERYKDFGVTITAIGKVIWELGVVGMLVYLCFLIFMWNDARMLARSGIELKWVGEWWCICALIIGLGLFYKNILNFNEVSYPMFLFAGVVASLRLTPKTRSAESAVGEDDGQGPEKPQTRKLQLAGRPTYIFDRYAK